MGKKSQITYWCHEIIRAQAARGGIYIDATMGKGNDTLLLCELAGDAGKVIAFDIQKMALEETGKLLKKENKVEQMGERVRLIQASHQYMDQYVNPESVDVICFNFGYLPGGDHRISTKADTSIEAIGKGLELLKPGGMMSLCIYSGGDTGFEEKERILAYLKTLHPRKYTVICNYYFNRENHPPIPVFIFKS